MSRYSATEQDAIRRDNRAMEAGGISMVDELDEIFTAINDAAIGIGASAEEVDAVCEDAVGGQDTDTTTGLTFGYKSIVFHNGSALVTVSAGTIALSASNTNYVEVNRAGTVSSNTSGFTACGAGLPGTPGRTARHIGAVPHAVAERSAAFRSSVSDVAAQATGNGREGWLFCGHGGRRGSGAAGAAMFAGALGAAVLAAFAGGAGSAIGVAGAALMAALWLGSKCDGGSKQGSGKCRDEACAHVWSVTGGGVACQIEMEVAHAAIR